ncbi:anti-anti-sigma factor [Acidobacteria bacterium SCGC AG-212-P17]|nr:anti-anti-sigma factor [Acidobacteria bacterium SCGC AG-212-P17]
MSKLPEMINKHHEEIRADWVKQMSNTVRRADLMTNDELESQSRELMDAIANGARSGDVTNLDGPAWDQARDALTAISASRAKQGFTTSETAVFVLSLKQPIFNAVRRENASDPTAMFDDIWKSTQMVDKLALITADAFQATREKFIARQQEELMELSTPVVKLWEGILALPIIGTLDSARTQVVMESLLQAVVQTNSRVAIIDITGVPTVDTLVAQHLLKTITAARLMGADCIISGVRPQIAQTIVHLGIDLAGVITKAKLSDAFALALQRTGQMVTKVNGDNASNKRMLLRREE